MHISGKLAIIGLVLFVVGIIGFFGILPGKMLEDPQGAVAWFGLFSVLSAVGFFIFGPSLCCYLWKHRED